MFWQEDEEFVLDDAVVDCLFDLKGVAIPVDHGHVLSAEIIRYLPWFSHHEHAGLHLIFIGSGNGWERPESGEMYISRRTKLILRLPKDKVEEAARVLKGVELNLDGHQLVVGKSKVKLLSTLTTLNARYVIADPNLDEDAFSQYVADEMLKMGVRIKRLLCGKSAEFQTPEGSMLVRSVMLADLSPEDSVLLQKKGIGPGRHMGCGIFIPHKGIESVSTKQEGDGE